MTAVEHLYQYSQPSKIIETESGQCLQLMTTKNDSVKPSFFIGTLTQPLITARCLRSISILVGTRFFIPPGMLDRILREADPVVTTNNYMLRFEGFSACCSTYARIDISEEGFDAEQIAPGTTNVDFQAEMRAALIKVREGTPMALSVGSDGLEMSSNENTVIEKKVKLPLRWLKGFAEVQSQQVGMKIRFTLSRNEAIKSLRQIPKKSSRQTSWVVAAGNGLRLAHKESDKGIALKGSERLKVLEDLAILAKELHVYSHQNNSSTVWVLDFGSQRFTLVLSADSTRGFSGEGQLLKILGTSQENHSVVKVQAILRWQSEIRPETLAQEIDQAPAEVEKSLTLLASRGLVGFDVSLNCYFHRVLPFDMTMVEALHPRLIDARKLVQTQNIQPRSQDDVVIADVPGTDVIHRVKITKDSEYCSCPWFAKYQGERGPCKHVLAVKIIQEGSA